MPGWKIQPAKKVDMPEDIADGLWVSIYHPKLLPFEAAKKFLAMAPKKGTEGTVASLDLDAAQDLANSIILDWNLPDKNGGTLPLPSNDQSVWSRIPALAVLTAILKAMGDDVKEVEPDPNS